MNQQEFMAWLQAQAQRAQAGVQKLGDDFTQGVAKPTFQFMQDQTARATANSAPPRPGFQARPVNDPQHWKDSADAMFAYIQGPQGRPNNEAFAVRRAMEELIKKSAGATMTGRETHGFGFPDNLVMAQARGAGLLADDAYTSRMGQLQINPNSGHAARMNPSPTLAAADQLPRVEAPSPVLAEQVGLTSEESPRPMPQIRKVPVSNHPGNTNAGGRTTVDELVGETVETPEQMKARMSKQILDTLGISLADKGSDVKYHEPRRIETRPPGISDADWQYYLKHRSR